MELKKDWTKTSIYCYGDEVDMIYRDMKNIFSFLIYILSECISKHMTNEKYNALPVDHFFFHLFLIESVLH